MSFKKIDLELLKRLVEEQYSDSVELDEEKICWSPAVPEIKERITHTANYDSVLDLTNTKRELLSETIEGSSLRNIKVNNFWVKIIERSDIDSKLYHNTDEPLIRYGITIYEDDLKTKRLSKVIVNKDFRFSTLVFCKHHTSMPLFHFNSNLTGQIKHLDVEELSQIIIWLQAINDLSSFI